ncbi:MAG: tetratricopeptide repeat protein [Chthoniobacterales bacterium]
MKWLLSLAGIVLLVLVGTLVFVVASHAHAVATARAADAALARRDYKAAIAKFNALLPIRFEPIATSRALCQRGYCHQRLGEKEAAERDYSEAIRLNSKAAWPHGARGIIRQERGDADGALADFSSALRLDPNAWEVSRRRARIYLQKHEPEKAIADFREAIRALPNRAEFYVELGNVYTSVHDWDTAEASFDSAIRIDPNNAEAYEKRGDMHGLSGDWLKATTDHGFARALAKPRDTERVRYISPGARDLARGNAETNAGNFDDAIQKFNEVIARPVSAKNKSTAYMNRGVVYYRKNDLVAALRDYETALQLDPSNARAYTNRASIRLDKGALADAIADCSAAIRLDPRLGEAYYNRGKAYVASHDFDHAMADLRKAVELDSTGLESVYNDLAWSHATNPNPALRDGKSSVEWATKSCDLTDWEEPGIIDTLAAAYAEWGDFNRAIAMQSKAIALTPPADPGMSELKSRLALYRKHQPYREAKH